MPILAVYAAAVFTGRHELSWQSHRAAFLRASLTIRLLAAVWFRQLVFVDAGRLVVFLNMCSGPIGHRSVS